MKGFNILILEDEAVSSVALIKAIQSELPEAHALRAASLFEARLFLAAFEIPFFIIDILLPDGNGIDFVRDVTAKNPEAGVVIITAEPLPKHRDRATSYGALHFLEKPVAPRLLGQVIRSHRASLLSAKPGIETSFSASLTRLSALDVIQLKCLARATLRLDFTLQDGHFGSVFFEEGQIIHAEANGSPVPAPLTGMLGLTEILSWRGGTIQEVKGTELPEPTLDGGWQSILLQAAQLHDERDA